ncbi:hypothetical protein C0J52_06046 [Blattella germanica]|nr:hypothetical protein C0J52_06046 [Blattella germanica]
MRWHLQSFVLNRTGGNNVTLDFSQANLDSLENCLHYVKLVVTAVMLEPKEFAVSCFESGTVHALGTRGKGHSRAYGGGGGAVQGRLESLTPSDSLSRNY